MRRLVQHVPVLAASAVAGDRAGRGSDDVPAFDAIAIVDDAPAGDVTIRTPRGLVITVPLDVDVERLRALLAAVSSC